jgi:hypothetical protein
LGTLIFGSDSEGKHVIDYNLTLGIIYLKESPTTPLGKLMIKWRSQFDQDIYNNLLIPVVKERPTTVFVGAGLSKYAGYPLVDDLINLLQMHAQQHTGQEIALVGDWKSKAQTCKNALGDANFNQILIDIFNPEKRKVNFTSLHEYLIQIQFKSIVTTNYDSCIELAFRAKGDSREPFYYPYLKETELGNSSIQHIHGYINPAKPHESVGSIVLTTTDFLEAYTDAPGSVKNFLVSLFSQQNVIFLGFNLNENVLIDILNLVKEVRGVKQRIAESRNLPPTTETVHFAILENKAEIENDHHDDQEDIRKKEEELVSKQDVTLQTLGVYPIRYNPDENYKSVENIIANMATITHTLSLKGTEAGDSI